MKLQLLTTKNGLKSGSLKRLAQALTGALHYKVWRTSGVRQDRKQFRYGDLVNKLQQYQYFKDKGLSAFDFTTSLDRASEWLEEGHTVFGRQTLTGSEGKGIVVLEQHDAGNVPKCPVYTKYKKKKREFRVHIFKDKVVTIVEKKKKHDWNGPQNSKIRNLANGYVFAQEIVLTDALRKRIDTLALAARKVCSSAFAGVDIGYNEANDDLFVIEVNSAPGIEGSNVGKYVEVIKQYA